MFWKGLGIGLFVGAALGVGVLALFIGGRE